MNESIRPRSRWPSPSRIVFAEREDADVGKFARALFQLIGCFRNTVADAAPPSSAVHGDQRAGLGARRSCRRRRRLRRCDQLIDGGFHEFDEHPRRGCCRRCCSCPGFAHRVPDPYVFRVHEVALPQRVRNRRKSRFAPISLSGDVRAIPARTSSAGFPSISRRTRLFSTFVMMPRFPVGR